jgi:hypothetical protein
MIGADFPNYAFNCYDFLHWFVTVLYFQHYEIYLLSGWVHILNSMFIKSKYQWSYWTGSKGSVSVCVFCEQFVCMVNVVYGTQIMNQSFCTIVLH